MPHSLSLRWMFVCGLLSVALLAGGHEPHAATLTPVQAQEHIEETATVCGVVASAIFASRTKGHPTFLNLDQSYPNHIFTVLIWGRDRLKFGQPEVVYKGKRLCVTGRITAFGGIHQIVVRDPGQIHEGAAATVSRPRTSPAR